jgi:hypothetical protein
LIIPLWNQTLTPLESRARSNLRIIYTDCEYDPDPEAFPEEDQPQKLPGESHEDFWERRNVWAQSVREVVKPEPAPFKAPKKESVKTIDLKRDFGERGLQIIVKLANIHLTPEKPEYAGGTWHVEGQLVHALYIYTLQYTANVECFLRTNTSVPLHYTIMIPLTSLRACSPSVNSPK